MEKDPRSSSSARTSASSAAFRVTEGLQKDFGEDRVIDTLVEAGILGTAIGMALRGYRPVEIQFDGFVYPAFDHIVSQVAKLHARSLGYVTMPIVIRIPSAAASARSSTTASPTRPTSPTRQACGSPCAPTPTTRTG